MHGVHPFARRVSAVLEVFGPGDDRPRAAMSTQTVVATRCVVVVHGFWVVSVVIAEFHNLNNFKNSRNVISWILDSVIMSCKKLTENYRER